MFRDASGRTVWTATSAGTQTTTYRDSSSRTLSTEAKTGASTTFRDASGRATSSVQQTGTSVTARDASGRTVGTSLTTDAKRK